MGKTGPSQLFGRKMEYVSTKKIVVDRIVEDPKTGVARIVQEEVEVPDETGTTKQSSDSKGIEDEESLGLQQEEGEGE